VLIFFIIVYFSYLSSHETYTDYSQDSSLDQFELFNIDIPPQIHKLYINDSINVIPFGAIKGYLSKKIQSMNIRDDTQCIYSYERPQKQQLYDYDLDISYINQTNSHLNLVSPHTTDLFYCDTNKDDIPMCSILSCNKYKTISLQRNAMSNLIKQNNKESEKNKLHIERASNNNRINEDNINYINYVKASDDIYNDFVL
jgi:hypothetical protein